MRFPPSLLDEIRARLPVSQVVGRRVSLKRAGREYKGLSPFKTEKTPSFTVNDRKGFYHCFASGEHGDIFTFLMKTEGVSFPEAVERLAEEAGVPMPKAGPRDVAAEDQRTRLYELLAASVAFFEKQLLGPQGAEARRYLAKRGLTPEGIARFRLGYAPGGKSALKEHLALAGFTAAEMAASGMLFSGDDIPVSYDRFRHRIMFPISDMKGRVIAFGGRALDPEAPAKYLNSPETPLFHKGAVLYNAYSARVAAHDKGEVLVVEGYMDAIALSLAGFPESVAPLGTALTEDQIKLLWRMAPEPTLCFDGDAAGRKAAFRAVETVLPHLKPGFSLQFVFLPDGLDPDDLVRQHGAGAMRNLLETRRRALFDVLIEREEQQGPPAVTPEQVAALEARLKRLVESIADPDVKARYAQELRQTLWAKSRKLAKALAPVQGRRQAAFAGKRRDNTQVDWRVRERANERLRLGGLPRAAAAQVQGLPARSNELSEHTAPLPPRDALLVAALVNHPWLLESHCEAVAGLTLTSEPLQRLKEALLALLSDGGPLDHTTVRSHLTASGLDGVIAAVDRAMGQSGDKFVRPEASASEAEAGWRHALALHETQVALPLELKLAERAWHLEQSEEAWERIVELQDRLARSLAEAPALGEN
jgi:DNA primase